MDAQRWNRIWEVFFASLEEPAGSRERFLDTACAGDAALRAEVAALLVAHGRTAFVDRAPALLAEVADAPELPSLIGERVGHYRVLREIGAGGMGTVYEAEQEAPVRRRVALKIIKLGMDTREVVARFEAERQALALMTHSNIARVFDAGATDDGRPYFAMELVEGTPVTEYCDQHRLGVRERLALFVAVCGGVQHAHQKGIIHRDLKPSNVLVAAEGEHPVPKIIDFGVAKAMNQRLTQHTLHTQLGLLIGTPSYMSPEQLQPDGTDVDTRTDIYALCVLLYELLTGVLPFDTEELRRQGYAHLQSVIRETDAPAPSAALGRMPADRSSEIAQACACTARELRSTVRGDLDWIVLKGLAKERHERYATPGDLAADIGRFLTSQPIQARPPNWAYRSRKFIRRHRGAVAIAVTVVVSLVAFAVTMTVQSVRLQRALTQAEIQRMRAEQVSTFLVELLRSSDPRRATSGEAMTLRDVLDAGSKRVATELDAQPAVKVRLLETMSESYRELGAYEQARALVQDALALAERGGVEPAARGRLLTRLGEIAHDEGNLEAAAQSYEQALAVQRANPGDDEGLADTLGDLAVIRLDLGEFAAAVAPGEEALALRERLHGHEHRQVGTVMMQLARAYNLNASYQRADAMFGEGMAVLRRTLGAGHYSLAPALNAYASFLRTRGRAPEAVTLLEEGLAIYRRNLGDDHAYTVATQFNLGNALLAAGRFGEAESLLQRTLTAATAHGDAGMIASTRMQLATAWVFQGRFVRAAQELREVVAADRKLRPDHPNVATSLTWLGTALREAGKLDDAQVALDEAVAVRTRAQGADHPDLGVALVQLGLTQSARGRHEDAAQTLERALELQLRGLGDAHPRIASNRAALARARFDAGDVTAGKAGYEEALAMLRRLLPAGHPEIAQTELDYGARLCSAGEDEAGRATVTAALAKLQAVVPADSDRLTRARRAC